MKYYNWQTYFDDAFKEMNDFFNYTWVNIDEFGRKTAKSSFGVRHAQQGNQHIFQMQATGISKEELKVKVEQQTIFVEGESKQWGKVDKRIPLADNLDVGTIKCKLDLGVLTITVDEVEKQKPQSSEIKVE